MTSQLTFRGKLKILCRRHCRAQQVVWGTSFPLERSTHRDRIFPGNAVSSMDTCVCSLPHLRTQVLVLGMLLRFGDVIQGYGYRILSGD